MSPLGESQTVKKTMKPSKIDLNTLPISEMLSSIYQKKIRQVKIFFKKNCLQCAAKRTSHQNLRSNCLSGALARGYCSYEHEVNTVAL